jgi:hypothetical protein
LYKVFQITACINAQKMIENSLPWNLGIYKLSYKIYKMVSKLRNISNGNGLHIPRLYSGRRST